MSWLPERPRSTPRVERALAVLLCAVLVCAAVAFLLLLVWPGSRAWAVPGLAAIVFLGAAAVVVASTSGRSKDDPPRPSRTEPS